MITMNQTIVNWLLAGFGGLIGFLLNAVWQAVNLVANEWHEIEALKDGAVFVNVFAEETKKLAYGNLQFLNLLMKKNINGMNLQHHGLR